MKRIFLVMFFLCVVSALSFAHTLGADQSFVIAPSQSLFLATQQTMPIDSLTPYNNGMPGSDRGKSLKTIGFWTGVGGIAVLVAGAVFTFLAVGQEDEDWFDDKDDSKSKNNAYANALTSVVLYSVGGVATATGATLWLIGNSR